MLLKKKGKTQHVAEYGIRERIAMIWRGIVPEDVQKQINYRVAHPHDDKVDVNLTVYRFDDGRVELAVYCDKDGHLISYHYYGHPNGSEDDYRYKLSQEVSELMKRTRLGGFDF